MRLKNYKPGDKKIWQGRVDSAVDKSALRWHQVIECVDVYDLKPALMGKNVGQAVLLGFESDVGVTRNLGREGARFGPDAVRQLLVPLPVHHQMGLADGGTISVIGDDLEGAQAALSAIVAVILKQGLFPMVLGGGHEVAYGHGKGVYDFLKSTTPQKKLGIINFDAHFDLREIINDKGTSGTPFLQLAHSCQDLDMAFHYCVVGIQQSANTRQLFNTASHLGVEFIDRHQIDVAHLDAVKKRLSDFINKVDVVYLTVCLDVFDAAFAPGVSAPQAYGLTPVEFFPLLDLVLKSKKVIVADIAELNPKYDIDNRTARLAAKVVWEVLRLMTPP